jgi:hypothetical protein
MLQPFVSPPVPAELPDWILALKPPDADVTAPTEGAAFSSLDAELDALSRADPDELARLAETAEQTAQLMPRDQAGAILEGTVKLAPPRARRRRARKMRRTRCVGTMVLQTLEV